MILFVDSLTVIDFSYLCPRRGAVGESWITDIVLHGDLNAESMVLDFAKVKKQIKQIIDEKLDHKLAIPSALSANTKHTNGRFELDLHIGDSHLAMSAPEQAVCMIEGEEVNEVNTIAYLKSVILPHLPDNVKDLDITLRPEATSGFYYHYSHGLKKHDGNCQRIIHGHRSLIGIKLNDVSMPRLQKQWADKWQDIYLASEEDLISSAELKHIVAEEGDYAFAYTSSQGYFELAISKSRCDILPCDTTVECIAEYLAGQIKVQHPNDHVQVRAYEGVGKGAIAYA
ncbi:6-carboxytetrahydropterin synthase [Pseudoalteromonas sp. McH1-7]|uniref:6-carboxytetrahydropterin synthase n=1 Tax=unclassified Pseudoalteromonas TaxID=194690 RepID=UPI001591EF95|nr:MULTISPECIES: 6-carboxytetrahydropterin synthase [unclassified Pseudoalteromonas]NUZ09242.1 6-carboxytetrahydropterin synthase [Pseudoalteromonas sp. McH1-7]USD30024.1 6-carboxytetrahydropterin synthase [Pseudoalteromonas sp. SCSIO 43201]